MEKNVKFRNSFLMILEKCLSLAYLWFLAIVSIFLEEEKKTGIIAVIVMLGVTIIVFLYNLHKWSKTYIVFDENAIIVEKNSINKSKITIAIASISNVNINRNIIQAVFGFRKIKLDTNTSFSSGSEIEIYLKTEDAVKFQKNIMDLVQGKVVQECEEQQENKVDDSINEITSGAATIKDILLHCVYTMQIVSIIVASLWAAFAIILESEADEGDSASFIVGVMGIVTIVIGVVGIVGMIIKSFAVFYKMEAVRRENELMISYGLLDKKQFRVPVKKICAIKIKQPMLGRIFKRYYAEVACVGVGDDEKELSLISLCTTKENLILKLKELLPEFVSSESETEDLFSVKKEDIKALVSRITFTMFLLCCFFVGMIIGISFIDEQKKLILIPVGIVTSIVLIAYGILKNRTTGVSLDKDYVKIMEGAFNKTIVITPYKKIEYIRIERGLTYKVIKYSKVNLVVKGSVINMNLSTGYITNDIIDKLKEKYEMTY